MKKSTKRKTEKTQQKARSVETVMEQALMEMTQDLKSCAWSPTTVTRERPCPNTWWP
ncbi:hypothetical protein [Flaviflagellibacter deserti]|jgi:hypothetical protein|uniref:Uncharacterized protein n=1 Tax=Flaviflagellibacter deserti TaxID=2267266 RepID=A0ABV9Z049_9HYPH